MPETGFSPVSAFQGVARTCFCRLRREELNSFGLSHLGVALGLTWLAGIGRYWDSPRASGLQQLGLGSVAYLLLMSGMIWLLSLPLQLRGWRYARIATYLGFTAPLAFLYAIPVERWMSVEDAMSANAAFLGVVAAWRLVLLFRLFRLTGELSAVASAVLTLLPVAFIVTALSALNLEQATFQFMGGLREPPTSADASYRIVVALSLAALLAVVPLLIAYVAVVVRRRPRAARG